MKIFKNKLILQKEISKDNCLSFVPTMGGLHEGHLSLIKKAKKKKCKICVSIFVNPTQFNDQNDYINYPRTIKSDLSILKNLGINSVFIPNEEELNISNQEFSITLNNQDFGLCEKYRDGHFEGVVTIVSKLCNIIKPKYLVLGKKDYQQLHVLQKYIQNFCYPIKVLPVKTVREKNGLAMSSRNNLLTASQLEKASELYKNILELSKQCRSITNISKSEKKFTQNLIAKDWNIEYLTVRSQKTLLHPKSSEKDLVVMIAAKIENIRLIDNIEFCIN
ncbi:MAG: Pantothenate synthetase [Arcobacter lacus]|nr:MAG: Pantothenate synthetase [Arcobacter lacus]